MSRSLRLLGLAIGGALLAATLVVGAGRLMAAVAAQGDVPYLVSYQGYLTDDSGPISDTVAMEFKIYDTSTGGNLQWEEVQPGVTVNDGHFGVQLGQVTSLSPSIFDGENRYLQVGVNRDNNSAGPFETLPRQRFTSVPYAHQAKQAGTAITSTYAMSSGSAVTATVATTASYASQAVTASQAATSTESISSTYAESAPWSGLTGVPPGFADGTDDSGMNYKYVVVVAKENGDYTSVVDALNSITPTASSPYLVYVMPGTYTETELVEVSGYVHLKGAGPNVTKVTSTRSNNTPNSDAATARLYDKGRISDLSLYNTGAANAQAIALWMADDVTHDTVVDNVKLVANGTAGSAHSAVYLSDAEPKIQNSWLHARGASVVNAGLTSVNVEGGHPLAHIENSVLLGADQSINSCTDNTGTGYGMHLNESRPYVRNSYICGGHRAILLAVNGNPQVHSSIVKVGSGNQSHLVETTAAGIVSFGTSQLDYSSLNTGAGSPPRCGQSYSLNFVDLDAGCEAP